MTNEELLEAAEQYCLEAGQATRELLGHHVPDLATGIAAGDALAEAANGLLGDLTRSIGASEKASDRKGLGEAVGRVIAVKSELKRATHRRKAHIDTLRGIRECMAPKGWGANPYLDETPTLIATTLQRRDTPSRVLDVINYNEIKTPWERASLFAAPRYVYDYLQRSVRENLEYYYLACLPLPSPEVLEVAAALWDPKGEALQHIHSAVRAATELLG